MTRRPDTLRYVVLHHTGHGEPHYDLMFQRPDAHELRTFRSSVWPITTRTLLTPLPDHRAAYLDYEGPVSGGRGDVRRIEAGRFAGAGAQVGDAGGLLLHLAVGERAGAPASRQERLALRLVRDEAGRWWIEPVAQPGGDED